MNNINDNNNNNNNFNKKNLNTYRILSKNILEFQEYSKQITSLKKKYLKEIINLLNECLLKINSTYNINYEIKLYGSYATDLCIESSDIDIVLVAKKGISNGNKVNNFYLLNEIYKKLNDQPWKNSIKLIETAIIPVIKISTTKRFNYLEIDISVEDANHYGLKCVELVKSYLNEFPALEPLTLCVKNFLKIGKLNNPYKVKYINIRIYIFIYKLLSI
jgi:non-canonical poly(A) RNA polymerase PAPD5/7